MVGTKQVVPSPGVANRGHRGQKTPAIVFWLEAGTIEVEPVYGQSSPDLGSLFDLLAQPSWKDDSSCRRHGDLFFTRGPVALFEARQVCVECPVFEECREWALSNYEECVDGIWAGYSQEERHAIARQDQPIVDWREDFNPHGRCATHTDVRYAQRGKNGVRYFICMACGTRVKQLLPI